MKKLVVALFVVLLFVGCDMSVPPPTAIQEGQATKDQNLDNVLRSVPIPIVQTAQERKNVAKRVERFDVENKLGYVYVFCPGVGPIGYYAIIGRVSSLNSFLVPQQRITDEMAFRNSDGTYSTRRVSGYYVMDDADLDGTYGTNHEGVFFFTDNDVYVEIPASMPYMYSDQPLPLKVEKLN